MTAWPAISSAGCQPLRLPRLLRLLRLSGGMLASAVLLASGCGPSGHGAAEAPARAYGRALPPMPAGTVARAGGEPALPEDPRQLRSPVAPTADNVAHGRALCRIYCGPCHGPLGHGDGPMAALLGVEVRDLAGETVAGLTDGEIYATITRGSKQMLGLRGLIAPGDRWLCVLGVRNLARAAGDSAVPNVQP